MYVVKRFAASGIYSGQTVESFDTLDEAKDYLQAKAKRFGSKTNANYFEVTLSEDGMHLEVYSDYEADNYEWIIVDETE